MTHMMFFGYGFCAEALTPILQAAGWQLSATTRDAQKAAELEARGITPVMWPREGAHLAPLDGITHGLISAPPQAEGDPVLARAGAALAAQADQLACSAICLPPVFMATMAARGLMKKRRLGVWVNAAKRGSMPKPNGAISRPSMMCRLCISASLVFMALGAIN